VNDAFTWLGGLFVGAALGVVFFGGLWWTVRRLAASPRSQPWLLASFAVRLALVALGLYACIRISPGTLLAALGGLMLARILLTRRILRDTTQRMTAGSRHAP
jgi:F1F0 ATPase subunit 2